MGEPQEQRQHERQEDAELTGTAQQHHLGVFQQGPKVGHRANADEDQQREQLVADAHVVQDGEGTMLPHHRGQRQVGQDRSGADR